MSITDLVYIDSTGYHYADFPTFLAFFTTQYQDIYGPDVDLDPATQDGQYVGAQAQAAYDQAASGAGAYASFAPGTARGVGLSRQVQINGLARQDPAYSTSDVIIGGVVGTTITNGVVQDTLNQLWNLPASVVIGISGTVTVTATSQVIGAITALVNTITGIYTPTNGWQTVTNPTAATPGAPVESDAALRNRQAVSTANPSLSVLDGTTGAVANVPGVSALQPYENDTGATDGNGIPGHTISYVVAGGDDVAVATAIALHKTPGTGTYGTTSEVIIDSHGVPNTIRFYRPTQVSIQVQVTITAFAGYSSGYGTLIQTEVAKYINALGIGGDVLITKLYIPANLSDNPAAGDTFDITDIQIGENGGSLGHSNITVAFNELAVCNPSVDVTVIV